MWKSQEEGQVARGVSPCPKYVPRLDARQNDEQTQPQACLIPNKAAGLPLPGLWISHLALVAIFNGAPVKWSIPAERSSSAVPSQPRGLFLPCSLEEWDHIPACLHKDALCQWCDHRLLVQVTGSSLLARQLGCSSCTPVFAGAADAGERDTGDRMTWCVSDSTLCSSGVTSASKGATLR